MSKILHRAQYDCSEKQAQLEERVKHLEAKVARLERARSAVAGWLNKIGQNVTSIDKALGWMEAELRRGE